MFKLSLLLLIFSISNALAKDFPPPPLDYVYDETKALSPEVVNFIYSKLSDLQIKTTSQVVVAVFKSLEGEDPVDYTNRLFKEWKIGQKGKDNGVLLALYLDERKMRIEVGYGLESYLTDAKSKDITSIYMVPYMKQKNVDLAVKTGIDKIAEVTESAFKEEATPTPADSSESKEEGFDYKALFALLFWITLICLYVFLRKYASKMNDDDPEYKESGRSRRSEESNGSDNDESGSGGSFNGGGGSSGGGGASDSW
jgi:uncharacterized protein